MTSLTRLCLCALLAIAATPSQAATVYRDDFFGFEVTVPDGWEAVPNRFFAKTTTPGTPANLTRLMAEADQRRTVAIAVRFVAKGVQPTPGVVSISFHGTFRQKTRDPVTLMRIVASQARQQFKDFATDRPPEDFNFEGLSGALTTFSFTETRKDGGAERKILGELWLLPHRDFYVQLGSNLASDAPAEVRAAADALMHSFKPLAVEP